MDWLDRNKLFLIKQFKKKYPQAKALIDELNKV